MNWIKIVVIRIEIYRRKFPDKNNHIILLSSYLKLLRYRLFCYYSVLRTTFYLIILKTNKPNQYSIFAFFFCEIASFDLSSKGKAINLRFYWKEIYKKYRSYIKMTLKIQLNASNNGKQELVSIATEHYHPWKLCRFQTIQLPFAAWSSSFLHLQYAFR